MARSRGGNACSLLHRDVTGDRNCRENPTVRPQHERLFIPAVDGLRAVRDPSALAFPPAILALVLLLQLRIQRCEVVEDGGSIPLALAGAFLQGVLPRLRSALAEHRPIFRAGFLAAVDRALVQRALEAGRLAQRTL